MIQAITENLLPYLSPITLLRLNEDFPWIADVRLKSQIWMAVMRSVFKTAAILCVFVFYEFVFFRLGSLSKELLGDEVA